MKMIKVMVFLSNTILLIVPRENISTYRPQGQYIIPRAIIKDIVSYLQYQNEGQYFEL